MSNDLDQETGDELDLMGPIDYSWSSSREQDDGEAFPTSSTSWTAGSSASSTSPSSARTGRHHHGIDISDLDGDGELDLTVFEGASSGLLGEDDLDEAGTALERAAPRASSSTRTSGRRPSPGRCARRWPAGPSGRIPVQAMLAALDAAEPRASV